METNRNNPSETDIYEELKTAIRDQGISLAELGRRCEPPMDYQSIQAVFNRRSANVKTLARIGKPLGLVIYMGKPK